MTVESPSPVPTWFDKYGSAESIASLGLSSACRVLERPPLATYFDGIYRGIRLHRLFVFSSYLLSQPVESCMACKLPVAHVKLDIQIKHFEEVIAIFRQKLLNAGISPSDAQSVVDLVEKHRRQIVGHRQY